MARVIGWLLLCLAVTAGCSTPKSGPQQRVTTTQPITLEGLIDPDLGPRTSASVLLSQSYPQQIFLTGASLTIRDNQGVVNATRVEQVLSGASLCFSRPERHRQLRARSHPVEPNIFVFCAGAMSVQLPTGWGIPLRSNEPLVLTAEWMNSNLYLPPTAFEAQVTLHYTDQKETQSVRPVPTYAMTLVDGDVGYWGIPKPDPRVHGQPSPRSSRYGPAPLFKDALGRSFQSKWMTPPGVQENSTLITGQLSLPLQVVDVFPLFRPGLQSLELRDLNNGRALYSYTPQKKEWQPCQLEASHQYQIRCRYHNPDPIPRSALAMLMLYVEDP